MDNTIPSQKNQTSSPSIRTMKGDIEELTKKGPRATVLPSPSVTPLPKPLIAEIKIPKKPMEEITNQKPSILSEIEKIEQVKEKVKSALEIPVEKLPVEKTVKATVEIKQPEISDLKTLKAIPTFEIPAERPVISSEFSQKIKKIVKISLIVLPIILVVGSGIGFSFYYFSAPPAPSEPKIPPALLIVDKIKIINLDEEDPILLSEKIKEVSFKKEEPGIFSQLLVKKSETICVKFKKNCVKKYSFLAPKDIYAIFKITPPNFLKNLDANHATIFIYQDGDDAKFGIIAEPEDASSAQNELLKIENNFYDYLLPFIRPSETIPIYESFQTASYKNIQIRYNNYPSTNQAIDYAFYTPSVYILIASSKNSMASVIDKLNETLSQ